MCAIPAILLAVGTAIGVVGQIRQSQAASQQASYQAQIAAQNRQAAEQNARETLSAGQAEEQRRRVITSQQLGRARANAGASGFDTTSESFLDEFGGIAQSGEIDALNARKESTSQANNYLRQAGMFGAEQSMYNSAANNARTSGWLNAAGSLIGGGSRVASYWMTNRQSSNPFNADPNRPTVTGNSKSAVFY